MDLVVSRDATLESTLVCLDLVRASDGSLDNGVRSHSLDARDIRSEFRVSISPGESCFSRSMSARRSMSEEPSSFVISAAFSDTVITVIRQIYCQQK